MNDRKCPLCGLNLVKQRFKDAAGLEPEIYCPTELELPEDKRVVNHYTEVPANNQVIVHIHPYRIVTEDGQSSIGVRKRYKTKGGVKTDVGSLYYKTVAKCAAIPPDVEDKLRERIKLLILLS